MATQAFLPGHPVAGVGKQTSGFQDNEITLANRVIGIGNEG